MNKQQAWDEWVRGKVDGYPTDIERSSHGRAFSAGWDAKQAPAGAKLDAFCNFIGSEPVENDGGWSLEVWNAAWEAATEDALAVLAPLPVEVLRQLVDSANLASDPAGRKCRSKK
jgi:hypothetical protein